MNILVTGDAGFIGAKLADKLVELGHTVVGVDKRHINREIDYKHITGDLSEWSVVESLGSFEVIYHIAGHSAGDLSIQYYESDIKDNLLSTAHILKLAKKTYVSQVIYASSMAVYGDQSMEKYPLTEDVLPIPRVYYGANKLAAENYLRIENNQNLKTTSLRLFNIYGPGQDISYLNQGMVSIFIGEFLKNPHLIMRGSPDRFRDFVYIDDTIDGLLSCLNNDFIGGEVINICTGSRHTIGELVELIREKLPFKTTIEYGAPSYFDLNHMDGDVAKAEKLLNFKPKINLEVGIEKTMKWVLKYSGYKSKYYEKNN